MDDIEDFDNLLEEDFDLALIAEYIDTHKPIRCIRSRHRPNYFYFYDDEEFSVRFRMSKDTVLHLYSLIDKKIDPPTLRNNAVTGMNRLLITLRFFATGSQHLGLADFGGVSQTSANHFVTIVTKAIAELKNNIVKYPTSKEELEDIKTKFSNLANIPNVIGAMGCTHIKVLSSGSTIAEVFRNDKGYYSLNVQAICGPNFKFYDTVVTTGSTPDDKLFRTSKLRKRLDAGDFDNGILIGDYGYENRPYLLTPIVEPTTNAEKLYNESHSRIWGVFDKAMTAFKSRFPAAAIGLRCNLDHATATINALCVLHNLAVDDGTVLPPPEVEIDLEEGTIESIPPKLGNDEMRQHIINTQFGGL